MCVECLESVRERFPDLAPEPCGCEEAISLATMFRNLEKAIDAIPGARTAIGYELARMAIAALRDDAASH